MIAANGETGTFLAPGARVALVLALVVVTQGCSAARRTALPYPAEGQSTEQRAADMAACDAWATAETAAVTQDDPSRGIKTLGGVLLGSALGAASGAAAVGAGGGPAGAAAAVGATIGAISGGLAAAVGDSVAERQMTADGFRNCMIAHGYVVEGGALSPIATNDLGGLGGVVGAVTSPW